MQTTGRLRGGHVLTPPHDLQAERAVIGAALVSEDALSVLAETLTAEDFYSETHRRAYAAMLSLYSRSEPVDGVTLSEELDARGEFDRASDRAASKRFVFELVESVPTAVNADRYAGIVREKAMLRRLIDAAARIEQSAYTEEDGVAELVERAERMIFEVARGGEAERSLRSLAEISPEALEEVQERYEAGGVIGGVETGFRDLDALTTGFHPGDLIILAARPSMGKTSLALSAAYYAATHGSPTAFFSLEMGERQLVSRLISTLSGLPVTTLRTGQVPEGAWTRLVEGFGELGRAPLYIDDSGMSTVPTMRAKLRRLSAHLRSQGKKLGLVVVDYLQLMTTGSKRSENLVQETTEISRGLKLLAREFEVPVLALSQLSRECEKRNNKRPMLSDLRLSGSLEQDADAVIFLYRDEYYNEDSEDRGVAEVIVGKHRQGPTGTRKLAWIEREARFASLSYAGVGGGG